MILVDTSVWIEVLKDRGGEVVESFRSKVGDEIIVLSRFTELELLQGARDEFEWRKLSEYLSTQLYLETSGNTWREAARIYFDLRRRGLTIGSPIDCCIAEIAIEHEALLFHRDGDFNKIGEIRKLRMEYFHVT